MINANGNFGPAVAPTAVVSFANGTTAGPPDAMMPEQALATWNLYLVVSQATGSR